MIVSDFPVRLINIRGSFVDKLVLMIDKYGSLKDWDVSWITDMTGWFQATAEQGPPTESKTRNR